MTLTEFSYYSRRMYPFLIILVLAGLVFFYAARVFLLYLEANTPKKVYINATFGKIKKPTLTKTQSGNFHFTLDTVEGQPITATASGQVYFLPQSPSKFGFREKIYLMAKNLGFDASVKHQLNNTEATFSDLKQKLSIDITNFNYTYEYDLIKDKNVFVNTSIPAQKSAEEKATDFMRSVGRYPDELVKGSKKTLYYVYDQNKNQLTPAPRPQDANVVEVDFYRPDVDPFPVVSPQYFNSQNYVIMVFNDTGFKVIKAQVRFFEKSESQIGNYPLITGNAAFKNLQEGKSLVVFSLPGIQNVTIKKMFLAYLDPDLSQGYLQPVYVFLGNDDFVGYVPAIRDDYSTE